MNIINNVSWITDGEIDLLKANAAQPFTLGKFSSLDDILSSLKVEVVIEPEIIEPPEPPSRLKKDLDHWEREAERLKIRLKSDACSDERYQEAIRNIAELKHESGKSTKHSPCGMFDAVAKVIKLYPNQMRKENDGYHMDELLVSTLAHETMHAYFSRKGFDKHPHAFLVEEPLAEFGMLLYLHEVGSSYYQWAYDGVKRQKSCYRYGSILMDQHLKEGAKSPTRRYLERYPILLSPYAMLSVNNKEGTVSLPQGYTSFDPVIIDGRRLRPRWEDVPEYPPRYYYDDETGTLCLDGDWGEMRIDGAGSFVIESKIGLYSLSVNRLYLGAHFYTDSVSRVYPIRLCPVYVSPRNEFFAEINNVPVYKKDNKPFLRSCGKGVYDICRNGKWGVIDENFNQVIPCKYDGIGKFSRNGLIGVCLRETDGRLLYGVINMQGVERIPVVYDSIRRNRKGAWILTKDGKEYTFDKTGNQIGIDTANCNPKQ
jgi:hypothetical protein